METWRADYRNMHSVQQMFAASIIWLYRWGKDRVWLRGYPAPASDRGASCAARKWRPFGLGSSDFLISGLVRLSNRRSRVEPSLHERQAFARVPGRCSLEWPGVASTTRIRRLIPDLASGPGPGIRIKCRGDRCKYEIYLGSLHRLLHDEASAVHCATQDPDSPQFCAQEKLLELQLAMHSADG